MMKVRTLEVAGLASALFALRLPFGKEVRSTITSRANLAKGDASPDVYRSEEEIEVDTRDIQLMTTLIGRGPEHAKVTRGIVAWAEINAPIYFWCELETYVVGHQRLSSNSTMHQDCQGLSGEALVEAKASIPMGKELTKVDFFSYQCLRNIYAQRHNHRLPEWWAFCHWIESLPYADELILSGLERCAK